MPNFNVVSRLKVVYQGSLTGEGLAHSTITCNLSESDGRLTVPKQGFRIAVRSLNFENVRNPRPTVSGIARVLVEEWQLSTEVPLALGREPGGHYEGDFLLDDVPNALRQQYEQQVGGDQPDHSGDLTTTVEVETHVFSAGRSLPAAFALVEAKGHIDEAKALIEKYINAAEPDLFGLRVLEALLREVDSLGDQLDGILSAGVVPLRLTAPSPSSTGFPERLLSNKG